jgi:histidinol-phosphatase (PHP family)
MHQPFEVPMLTDYHTHLRPDDAATPAEVYFTPDNVERYRQVAAAAGIRELGVSEHIHRFSAALEIWRHPFWVEQASDDLDSYCEFVSGSGLRLGIEADYVAGAEDRIEAVLGARRFDYVIGSVHFVGEAAVDQDRWDLWEAEQGDPDRVWQRYFEQLAAAAATGLFDVMAHPDLVKVWGAGRPGPDRDPRHYYEPAVAAIAEAGVAAELSTAGLRKPVAELYPSAAFARMLADAGVPFSLSSDAHIPEEIGYAYDRAVAFLRGIGVGEIAVFEGRVRRMEPLG